MGELAIGAARLGLWDRVAPKARELGDVCGPWASRRCGCCRCAGSACRWRWPPTTGRRRSAGPPRWRRPSPCTHDWERWRRRPHLGGDPGRQRRPRGRGAAARGLQELGLTWEASRLTGQAAIRSADPSVTRALLEQARDLKAALPAAEAADAAAVSVLSEREQMVAQYIVDGLTHKEIGAQLYISPKTVEHHVAKIRQKMGASTRAEMLAALRTHLAS